MVNVNRNVDNKKQITQRVRTACDNYNCLLQTLPNEQTFVCKNLRNMRNIISAFLVFVIE